MNNMWEIKRKEIRTELEDWHYMKETTFSDMTKQQTIYDWIWDFLDTKDSMLYNKWNVKKWITKQEEEQENYEIEKRWQKIEEDMKKNIADIFLWADFKKPSRDIKIIQENELDQVSKENETINVWYFDNLIVESNPSIFKEKNSIAIWWAVWDCAGISSFYKGVNKQIMGITHAWHPGLKNNVVEQLIYAYKTLLWREEFKKVNFDISPLAGINYEFEENILLKLFKKQFREYDIDHIQDWIFIPYYENKEKWFFMIWKLLERIFLENGIEQNQLNFHDENTTLFENKWPSHRLHTLSKNWQIDMKNVPDSRMWVFNIIRKSI